MAAERKGAEERMERGIAREEVMGVLSVPRQREAAARQARRCVAAPEEATATSCCRLAEGRRQGRLGLGQGKR